MKNSRRCPKCGGAEVIRCKTAVNGAYDKLQAGVFRMVQTDRWVCCSCGYCELWADPEHMNELKDFWGTPETDP